MSNINVEDISIFYDFFNHKNPTEIRVFDKIKFPNGKSIFVNSKEDFIKEVKKYSEEEKVDVYIGVRDRVGTNTESIVSSDLLFFEIDEHDIKKPEMKDKVEKLLAEYNIEIGMSGFSGGGYHFYIPVNEEKLVDEEQRKKYIKILNSFKTALLENKIDVDTKCFDLPRVMRILGSYNYRRNNLSKIEKYNLNVDRNKNTENVSKLINKYVNSEKIEINSSSIEILEKYRINLSDKWLYEIIKNNIKIKEDTGGNSVVLKNAAIILLKNNLLKSEIEVVSKDLIKFVEGRTLAAFYGWIKQAEESRIFNVYKNEINNFIRINNYELTPYVLEEAEKIDNKLYVIKNMIEDLKANKYEDNDSLRLEAIRNIIKSISSLDRLYRQDLIASLSEASKFSIQTLNKEIKDIDRKNNIDNSVDNNFTKAILKFVDKKDLAQQFLKIQPLFYERKNQFWVWDFDKFCWVMKDEVDILNLISKNSYADTIDSKNKNEILEALKQQGRNNKPKDIKPTWVQFYDTIYDIETKEKFKSSPEFFVTNPIMWKVGESEETPKIDELFKSWVIEEEEIKKLYEIIAFVIVPKYFIHSFFFLFSPPGMGKSTFVNLIIKFIGKDNCAATSIDRINHNSRFETINWYKKLLITLSEVSDVNDLKNSGLVNQATGEDNIPYEIKGGDTFKDVNYGKFIYPTNKLLKIDENDGFGRRVRTIKFKTRFEKEKDVISEISDSEFENLARKCIRIANELWTRRSFTGDVNISERMKNYQEISKSQLECFIDNYCDLTDSEAKMNFDEFYSKYITKNGLNKSKIIIARELRKLGFIVKVENWPVEKLDSHNNPIREWASGTRISGIKWNNNIK